MSFGYAAALVGFFQVSLGAALHAQAAVGGLPPGEWPVGFMRFTAADSTRALESGQPRLVDVGVWYPARRTSLARLTYREYFLYTPPHRTASPGGDAVRREFDELIALLESREAPDSVIQNWMRAPMLATVEAPPSGGRFPLVLLAQGNAQTVHDQAPLAEYLASHGYVVATMPSPMRIAGPLTDEREVGARAEEQALDLGFLRRVLADRRDVLDQRVGVVAHSFGARAALLLAMLDSQVAAVVSLDGGIGTASGRTSLEALPFYRTEAARAPILHFYEELDAFMAPEFGLLRSLTAADRWLVSVPALHHHHFTSLGAVSIQYPSLRRAIGASAATAQAYTAVAVATREFLDTFLKADSLGPKDFRRQAAWPHLGRVEAIARRTD
jgi:dienelactone hydrolase